MVQHLRIDSSHLLYVLIGLSPIAPFIAGCSTELVPDEPSSPMTQGDVPVGDEDTTDSHAPVHGGSEGGDGVGSTADNGTDGGHGPPPTTDSSGDGGINTNLDPNAPPGENFDLERWKITFADASEESQEWLTAGGERPGEFYTDPITGGMVFSCPTSGETTSGDTKYARTELREMLRGSDTDIETQGINGNNWVTSTSSASNRDKAGGVDGTLNATLRVDHVSTSTDEGSEYMLGRIIVGQIHAPDDEPCKIYYRKLPDQTQGSVYFAYEPPHGDPDVLVPLVGHSPLVFGSPADDIDPPGGIELGERWSYEIDVNGHALTVTITRDDGRTTSQTVVMDDDYDDVYLYFKAGNYNQNNGGTDGEYAQTTFYELTHHHD